MKLTKDRFTCWECIDDNDYEEKYDDELIISVNEGETNRDIADYILDMQSRLESLEKYIYDNTEWHTGMKDFDPTLKSKQHDLKLRLNGKIGDKS